MKIAISNFRRQNLKLIKLLLIIILVLGIVFRFINIENKVYWTDETYTAMRASGYTELEVIKDIRDRSFINSEDLQKYQYSNESKKYKDVINSLASEDPHHPPLYYLMSKLWVHYLGDTVAARRSLSALASLFIFPLIYWLSLELFNSTLVGLVAMALVSISPFHVLYAQEARQYSLWTVMILFSNASLLWALRRKTNYTWAIYSVSLALSFYTFLLSVFLVISHGLYILVIEGFGLSKNFIKYLLSFATAILLFLPWLLVILNKVSHIDRVTGGSKRLSGLNFYAILLKEWFVNLSRIFADIVSDSGASSNLLSPLTILLLLIVCFYSLLTLYAIYFVYRNTPKRVWAFLIILIFTTYSFLILPDLALGDNRSMVSRLFTPAYLCIQLSVAYFITSTIKSWVFNSWKSWIRLFIVTTIFLMGIISCIINVQTETSWIKGYGQYNHLVAREINRSFNPLLVSNGYGKSSDVISLSYYLNKKVKIFSRPTCYTCSTEFIDDPTVASQISNQFNGFSDIFFFNSKLPLELEKQYKLTPVFLSGTRTGKSAGSELFKLERL